MNNINDLKNIVRGDMGVKKIGIVIQKQSGSVLFEDFQSRTFMASIESNSEIKVGDAIIVANDVVVGKTELEEDPTVFTV